MSERQKELYKEAIKIHNQLPSEKKIYFEGYIEGYADCERQRGVNDEEDNNSEGGLNNGT